jgi:CheY-like chemotaxis protein
MPAKPTVVVVDDEPPIVEMVCDLLEDADVEAVPCGYGHGALPCIRTVRPNLVILDVQMPGIDGIDIFQQMRADPETKDTPVIFLTANAHKVYERLPEYHTMNAQLLSKPFTINSLLDLVETTLAA